VLIDLSIDASIDRLAKPAISFTGEFSYEVCKGQSRVSRRERLNHFQRGLFAPPLGSQLPQVPCVRSCGLCKDFALFAAQAFVKCGQLHFFSIALR
jgi:hypothetical protein